MPSMLWLAVLALCFLRKSNSSATPTVCSINKVLVESNIDATGTSKTEVNVQALGHCHKNKKAADTLKFANPEKTGKSATIYTRLTHSDYGAPYKRSCRRGLLESIYTKDEGSDSNHSNVNLKRDLLRP